MVVNSRKLSRKYRTNRVLNPGPVVCESSTLFARPQRLLQKFCLLDQIGGYMYIPYIGFVCFKSIDGVTLLKSSEVITKQFPQIAWLSMTAFKVLPHFNVKRPDFVYLRFMWLSTSVVISLHSPLVAAVPTTAQDMTLYRSHRTDLSLCFPFMLNTKLDTTTTCD